MHRKPPVPGVSIAVSSFGAVVVVAGGCCYIYAFIDACDLLLYWLTHLLVHVIYSCIG